MSVSLAIGNALEFSANSLHFHTFLHFLVLPEEKASYMVCPETRWNNLKKNLLRKKTYTKKVWLVYFRQTSQLKMNQNKMYIVKLVSQHPG